MSWRVALPAPAAGVLLGLSVALAMHRPAQAPEPNAVDVGFAQSMLRHHDQAVEMARILLQSPDQLAAVARSIQTAQLLEIGQMRGWLILWDQPLLPAKPGMEWMLLGSSPPGPELKRYLADCKAAPGGMPGLASGEEMERLRSTQGAERDRLFLTLMIRHHQGALPMARFAAANAALPAVRSLAAQIAFDQAQEIEKVARLLQTE